MSERDENSLSDNDEEEEAQEEGELPQVPINLTGPKQINVGNSQDVKIGPTFNMTFNVGNLVVNNEETNQMIQGAPPILAGMLMNPLITNRCLPFYNAIEQTAPTCITSEEEAHCSMNRPLKPHSSRDNPFPLLPVHAEQYSSEDSKKPHSSRDNPFPLLPVHAEQYSSEDWKKSQSIHNHEGNKEKISFTDQLLNQEILNEHNYVPELCNRNISVDFVENKTVENETVSVYSLIDEFVQCVNNFMIVNSNDPIETPSISDKVDWGVFKHLNWKLASKSGKLTGFLPLIRKKGFDIDVNDKLVYVSVPLKLKNLQIAFDDFSMGWKDCSFTGLMEIKITKSYILLNLITTLVDGGYSENDVSAEVRIKDIKVELKDDFIGNEVILKLAKDKIEKLFFEKYVEDIVVILEKFLKENVITVLNANDVCAKLASYYLSV